MTDSIKSSNSKPVLGGGFTELINFSLANLMLLPVMGHATQIPLLASVQALCLLHNHEKKKLHLLQQKLNLRKDLKTAHNGGRVNGQAFGMHE